MRPRSRLAAEQLVVHLTERNGAELCSRTAEQQAAQLEIVWGGSRCGLESVRIYLGWGGGRVTLRGVGWLWWWVRGKVGLIRIRMIEVHPRVHVDLLSLRFSVPFSEIMDKNDPSTFDVLLSRGCSAGRLL